LAIDIPEIISHYVNNMLQRKSCNVNFENNRPPLVFKEALGTDPKLIALIENAFASFAGFGADALFIGIRTSAAAVVCNKNLIMRKANKNQLAFC